STPSTSSSRRALASCPSSTWTRTRRSLSTRSQRRAALRRRRRLAGSLARKPCVVRSPVLGCAQRHPRLGSALVVLVVAVPPDARLVAPLGGAVEPLVHAPEAVQSARIGGIGVVDDAVLERERAQARPVARVRGDVGSGHGRDLRDGPLAAAQLPLSNGLPCERLTCRRLAPVVVFDTYLALLLLSERGVEVEVEVAAERGRPGKRPPHTPLVLKELRERRPRHRRKWFPPSTQLQTKGLDESRERGGLLPPTRVVEEEAGERRAPIIEHPR